VFSRCPPLKRLPFRVCNVLYLDKPGDRGHDLASQAATAPASYTFFQSTRKYFLYGWAVELLFNICWLLLAFGAPWFFLPQSLRSCRQVHTRRVAPLRAAIILGCALDLLFPIVSISDDLQEQQSFTDDSVRRCEISKAPKALVCHTTKSCPYPTTGTPLLCFTGRWRATVLWQAPHPAIIEFATAGLNRAPPEVTTFQLT